LNAEHVGIIAKDNSMRPLEGVKVLDFSTLLPGPMATLILAEAGAEIIKVERPRRGDEMRSYVPKFGDDSVNFALLNRGKKSIEIDLKAPDSIARLRPLIQDADIVIEQFRPGVMDRLGFGYESLKVINPTIIYCAITGYGQSGPKADKAAHDLNYVAESGLLSLSAGNDGAPVLPPALIADIAGGTYPAVINILLALRVRDRSGTGSKLDIAMCDNLFTFLYWAMGNAAVAGQWPTPGGDLLTGGSPRYQIYRTKDDRFVAAAPLEEKFWENFCDVIELSDDLRDDAKDPAKTLKVIAEIIAENNASFWRSRFSDKDICCCIVATLDEALADPHFKSRSLFDHQLVGSTGKIAALPVPVANQFRSNTEESSPRLGANNELIDSKSEITT